MRTFLIMVVLGTLAGIWGCGSEEKPLGKAPEVKPEDSGAGPPPELKKGGRIPKLPK